MSFWKKMFGWLVPEQDKLDTGSLLTKPASDDAIKVIYGRRKVQGTIVFQNVSNPDDNDDVTNDLLHLVIVWSEAVSDIETIWLGDYPITDKRYDGVAFAVNFPNGMHGYSDPHLKAAGFDPITKGHSLSGLACSYIRLEWLAGQDNVFSGVPNIQATISGCSIKGLISNSNYVSSNPAECLYDYLTNKRYGKGLSESELDRSSFINAAKICNTQVPLYDGAVDKRSLFTVNIALDTSNRVLDNVHSLLKTMRGSLPVINGKLTLLVEQDDPVVPHPITASMTRNTLKYSEGDKSNRFNRVVVEFPDEEKGFSTQQAIFPEPSSETFKKWSIEDNGVVLEHRAKINGITNYYEARQMARIIAMLSRESLALEMEVSPIALQYTHGDIIPINYEKLGFDNKPFRLIESVSMSDGWFKLKLREHQPHIYDWLNDHVRQPIPDSGLPDPRSVDAPEGISFENKNDGQVLINWVSRYYLFDVEIYRDNRRLVATHVTQPEYLTDALESGDYVIEIRARSSLGYSSQWVSASFSINAPSLPIIEELAVTHNMVTLLATVDDAGLGTSFEWRFTGEGTQKSAMGSQLTFAGLLPDKTYAGSCRTINVTGHSAWKAFEVRTKALTVSEMALTLQFKLTQSPSWFGAVFEWIPSNNVHNVQVELHDSISNTTLGTKQLSITLDVNSGFLTGKLESEQGEVFTVSFEGQGTSSLTVSASFEGIAALQTFSAIGVSMGDLEGIKEQLNDIDELAESVLEQALDAENVFEADLHSTLKLEQKTDITNAVISEAVAAQATENEAIATKISSVKSEVEDSKAQIVEVSQTLATTEQALATKITQLTSTVDENHAEIKTYYITKADSESAVSQAKTELQSKVNDNLAYLNQTFYTAARTDDVISAKASELRAEYNDNHATITDNYYTKSAANEAIAAKVTTLESKVNKNISGLSEVYFSKSDNDSALANFVRNVSVSTPSGTASVINLMTAHSNKLGQLEARAEIGVDVNGHVTGMTITPGQMRIKAGVFELLDNSNNSAVYFDTSSGRYTFNGHVNATSGTFTGRVEASSGTLNYMTLQSCTWNVGNGSILNANSGQLSLSYYGMPNVKFWSNGDALVRHFQVINGAIKKETGVYVKDYKYGIQVDATSFALYALNGEIGPHTSAHETLLPKELTPEPGDILCDDELMHIANISNAICTAKLSSSPMDVTARGVYTRRRSLTDSQPAGLIGFEEWEQLAYLYDVASINAGGEGAMNVCGEGGNLQTGDLICSSSMPGKGMRQPTQSEERYTIAQVRHNVTFDSPDQVKMVAVIYKRG
ncbi:hypothetical protein [Pseudoalteromonas sp. S16_S37]|uniref:hypothetical protein n=1 Tax=Pseudoalteromonas sp. S16_S37 TaxID=2720228 RepID=UPI0016801AB4|nr:hypothetical protein [Pseudoalteromonas sp. S16_S37]MBD1583505.1 hypothetical protein [Pseudoalteromonas sp. S16_S37]